jgi:hypothetical protein
MWNYLTFERVARLITGHDVTPGSDAVLANSRRTVTN